MKKMWEFKQSYEEKPKILDLYIYGDVEGGEKLNYTTWEYEKSATSAEYFKEELDKYTDLEQINLYVNTYGGSVYEAMSIRNQLKRKDCKVIGIVDGFAASAGSFVLTGCDEVKMYSNTMQMIHNMWNVAIGNATQLRKAADDLDKMMEGNRKAYLEKSNGKLTEEKLIELLDNESWLTAEDCLQYGLCDEIIDQNVDLEAAKEMMQKVNKTFEQSIKYNQLLQKMINEPVEEGKDLIKEPTGTHKQLNNFDRIRQKFMKKSEDDK